MSEDQKQDDAELFDSDKPEESSPVVSNTEATDDQETESEESESEENEEALVLDENEGKSSKREEEKRKQIDAWFKKISTGDKTLEDIPKHQKWLSPFLEERLLSQDNKEKVKEDLDVKAIVREELKREKDVEMFSNLKHSLNEMKLTADQKAEIQSEYKENLADGLSKAKALTKAAKVAGVKEIPDKRPGMFPPRPSTQPESEQVTEGNWRDKLKGEKNFDKRMEKLNKLSDPQYALNSKYK